MFQTKNPATGETLRSFEHLKWQEIDQVLDQAWSAYQGFKTRSVHDRVADLRAIASGFRSRKEELARSITLEMGKALKDSLGEVEKSATAFDYYAETLESLWSPESVKTSYARSEIVKNSVGPVLAVMPWNFPVWQVVRFAAPAVGIGNPILLKHADLVAGTAEIITSVFQAVRPGLLFNLQISHDDAAKVLADRRCVAVTLTGSAAAGRKIAETAGRELKKSVLELGGSDAYVVFKDADVEKAAKICANGRMTNNGQSCVAAKRFVVHSSIKDRFLEAFEKQVRALPFGPTLASDTLTGSLASKKFQEGLLKQCRELEASGGKLIFDVDPHYDYSKADAYFPARAYLCSSSNEFAFTEEFFGPVALVFEFNDEAEALKVANKSVYGLGGAVFSSDLARATRFAHLMECGFVAINDQVKSDPHLPFGGVKDSGYGRELSAYGFHEFVNVKTLGYGST